MITLMTDFGSDSPYVAAIKGVILERAPQIAIVDLTHSIEPQNIRQGALVWHDFTTTFPHHTIHVGVVDPEVGGQRNIIAATINRQCYICPDNGLITLLAEKYSETRVFQICHDQYWRQNRQNISMTFHGRDIMAPVAAALATGTSLDELGVLVDGFIRLAHTPAQTFSDRLIAEIIYIDHFGNLFLNVTVPDFPLETIFCPKEKYKCRINNECIDVCYVNTYCHAAPGNAVLLTGSTGRFEIAIVNGNAAKTFQLSVGHSVTLFYHG